MRPAFVFAVFVVSSLGGLIISPASAQDARWSEIGVSASLIDFDLSGTGQTGGLAVRATRDLTPHVVLETRGLFTRPDQQFGPSTMIVPEAQLQYRWSAGRWSPFVGAGGGFAVTRSDFDTSWDSTIAFAAGTGVRLTRELALLGEMRVRGVEWRFVGSMAEWGIGLAWRLP